ncbi:MAG: ferredoxin [Clostridiales bacterium]|nr:ferredoxin [Candidatus Cacconaster stercorequi]
MKAMVNQKACIRCGLCPTICPEVFSLPDNGESAHAITEPVPAERQAAAQEAADNCPTGAIEIS